MANYYQPEIETASREQILAWQNERLVKQVQHVWDNVPYYRKKMEEKGLTPADIQSVADLHKLPFLSKDDLREAYPYGLLAMPLSDCVRIQSTSGTTGKRVAPVRSSQPVAPRRMSAMYPMVTVCLPAAPVSTAAPIRLAV